MIVLAAVLGLEGADLATLGALAPALERSLGVSHAQLGLLASGGTLAAFVATLPMGVLADRAVRTRLLAMSVALWGTTMIAAGAATGFWTLLLARVALGAVTAAAGPLVASLVGDYFPPGERGRVYGLILAGEMAGSGLGFLVSGNLAGLVSWRWACWVLAVAAFVVATAIHVALPEPERWAGRATRTSLPAALRALLRIRTNVLLMIAAAIGNFFFAGVRTFTVVFVVGHYGLSPALATSAMGILGLGALVGILAGGRIADRLHGGRVQSAPVTIAAAGTIAAALLWIAPLTTSSLTVGLVVGALAAAAMNLASAPLEAARLDIVPAHMRGRAESVRALTRAAAFASAPAVFGMLSGQFGYRPDSSGIRNAFLLMLVPLALAGVILLLARRTYERDARRAVG